MGKNFVPHCGASQPAHLAAAAAGSGADIFAHRGRTSGNYWGWPHGLAWGNYKDVFTNSPMGRYMLNSIMITLPTVAGTLALSCMAGFAFAVYRFRLSIVLFAVFVAGNFVPFQILMIPVRDLTVSTGLYDTKTSLVLFHTAFQTGFCTLFMRNFIRSLPRDLLEAARIDGASEFRIFWCIVLPLMRPAIAALAVLVFTFVWNDFFWGTVLVQSNDAQPVTSGLKSLNGQ